MVKIFIDPGHGGTDPGAVGFGIQEKNVTLQIGLKIRDILEGEYSNVSVRMSRTGDSTVSLSQRTNAANSWGADFLYSVHVNSGGGVGYEDFIYNKLSNSSRTAQMQRTIHSEIISRINMTDRGMKKADFHMLRETNMDAVLTENGFIDNASDTAKMKNPAWIESVARGHVAGLEKVFNLQKKQVVAQAASSQVADSADGKLVRGERGPNVQALNQMLRTLEYTTKTDNLFDQYTEAALLAFQKDYGLTQDAVYTTAVGEVMLRAIAEKNAKVEVDPLPVKSPEMVRLARLIDTKNPELMRKLKADGYIVIDVPE
ncbi:hypothetical protein DOE78_23370 [Bacillus sp. Y1]|nr:N-acetylmuramoyl-L-alanine amidase [Bacillus sp. Y1]AYA78102.1 hypothetical protein DOE78_23370 [Bacillus sp. Y1]